MIIGITGKARSGKDTIADVLVKNYGFVKINYADHLKKCTSLLFNFNNDQMYNKEKDIIDVRYNKTPRELLQWFGTDVMRKQFDNDFWINHVENQFDNKLLVISDVRFQNEADLIKKYNGIIIKVTRKNALNNDHESENQNIKEDFIIDNDDTKQKLINKINNIMTYILK